MTPPKKKPRTAAVSPGRVGNFGNFTSTSSAGQIKQPEEVTIHLTKVTNLIVVVANKAGDPDSLSFMHGLAKAWNNDKSLKEKWNLMDIMCLSHDGKEIVRNDAGYPCKVGIGYVEDESDETLTAFGNNIACQWTIVAKKVNKFQEKFKLHAINSTAQKPLNAWIRNSDCIKILASCYNEPREELMEDEELMSSYFGDAETGKEILESIDENEWK